MTRGNIAALFYWVGWALVGFSVVAYCDWRIIPLVIGAAMIGFVLVNVR
jgi:hypothetical protein